MNFCMSVGWKNREALKLTAKALKMMVCKFGISGFPGGHRIFRGELAVSFRVEGRGPLED